MAPVDGDEPRDRGEQRRLAGAVRAEEGDRLPGLGPQRDREPERAPSQPDVEVETHAPSHRSRRDTSTTTEMTTSTRLSAIAVSGLLSKAR